MNKLLRAYKKLNPDQFFILLIFIALEELVFDVTQKLYFF